MSTYIRHVNYETDYVLLEQWWKWHGWDPLPQDMLPKDGGFMVVRELDDLPICAGFIYDTGTKVAWLEFIVSSPSAGIIERAKAVREIIECCVSHCKERGIKAVFTSLNNNALIRLYQKSGFALTETGMTNLVLSVNGGS